MSDFFASARPLARGSSTLAIIVLTGACATGSTFRSGVGDRLLEHPPWYAGARVIAGPASFGHLPIAYQRGGSQSPMFDPEGGRGTPIATLLAEMNAYMDSLGTTVRVATADSERGTPPDVRFGCETDASGECTRDETGALGREGTTMLLAVGRPSESWTTWAAGAMDETNVARAVVLTLEMGQYWTRQTGWRGDKSVELGSGHTAPLPWLTSVETPVTVLQLTGALVDREGKAIRIGAEGLLARRTGLLVSALGAQELLTDEDVQQLRTSRRDDLPGRPLVWQVALRSLMAELTGRADVALR